MITENFQNPQIFDLDLPDFEAATLKPVSKAYLKILVFNLVIFTVMFAGAALGAVYFAKENLQDKIKTAIIGGVLLIILYSFFTAIVGFKFRKYAVREHDLIYQHGLVKRSVIIIPFSRIQHIKVEQGWLSRILKLKTISVFTAGSHGGDVAVKGLPEEEAEKINQFIGNYISKSKNKDFEKA